MTENRNQLLADFVKKNPSFANPEGHHRRLADWSYDTKYRDKVARGEMTFETALAAAGKEALETMPRQTEASQIIAEMAIARNQPIPTPSINEYESEEQIAGRQVVAEIAASRGQIL